MKYIIANWKMNFNLEEVTRWLYDFEKIWAEESISNTVVLATSAVHAERVSRFVNEKENLFAGLQDSSHYEKGAHTGEIGAFQIKDYAKFCLVGHSERKETREEVLAKRDACLGFGITPVVCFINPDEIKNYYKEGALLAWEDPDNISQNGQYREKDPQEIADTFSLLKKQAPEAVILYGGSVHPGNVEVISQIEEIDGILVGNASLDPQKFMKLIKAFS
jgi:triosephosphate isomerase